MLIVDHAHRAPHLLSVLASWAADETASPDFRAPGLVAAAVNADPQRLIAADAGAPDGKNLLRVRMRTVARGEFYGVDNDFPERLLALDFPGMLSHDQSNRDLVLEEAMRGGYPDGRFGTADERHDFFHHLVRRICGKDLQFVSKVRSSLTLRKVFRMAGAASGEVLNLSQLSSILGIGRPLVRRCLEALEALYMIDRLSPWEAGLGIDRAVRSDRCYVSDSGWLCGLLGFCSVDPTALPEGSQTVVERLISGWTRAQLGALIDQRPQWRLSYFALRTGLSVEFLLENAQTSDLTAIRTSTSERVDPGDFSDLARFRGLVRDRRVACIVLYCGQSVQRLEGLGAAVPLAFLWR